MGPAGPTGPAGSVRAYGLIKSDGTIDTARSRNIAQVVMFLGIYCVNLDPSIDLNSATAFVTPHFGFVIASTVVNGCSDSAGPGVSVLLSIPSSAAPTTGDFYIMIP